MEKLNERTGLCLQAYIPVRSDPFERAEMTTQVIFGEYFNISGDDGKWLHIRHSNDGYEGWIDKKCASFIESFTENSYLVAYDHIKVLDILKKQSITLPIGASIPDIEDRTFAFGAKKFLIEDTSALVKPGNADIDKLAVSLLSTPYIWGGRSGFGFDCSGLTQFLCKALGKSIPRDASEQAGMGTTLNFISEAQSGDLAFFDDAEGLIHHVGMIIGPKHILHASGKVKIDRIDQQGIFSTELEHYTHKLRILKRL